MKKSIKNSEREEEVADEAKNSLTEELSDIQQFIEKRRLQNKILSKLTEELNTSLSNQYKKPKSA
jgi:hypothetical protein